jgi:hypothetical protein
MCTPSANSVNEISYSWYAPPDEDELDEDADELLELLLAVVPRVILLLMRSKIDMAAGCSLFVRQRFTLPLLRAFGSPCRSRPERKRGLENEDD